MHIADTFIVDVSKKIDNDLNEAFLKDACMLDKVVSTTKQ